MRTPRSRIEARREIEEGTADEIRELCFTIDDAAEMIADALRPLEQLKDILSDIQKNVAAIERGR